MGDLDSFGPRLLGETERPWAGVRAHGRDLALGEGAYLRDTSAEGVMLSAPWGLFARGRTTSIISRISTIFRSLLLLAVVVASVSPARAEIKGAGLRRWADLAAIRCARFPTSPNLCHCKRRSAPGPNHCSGCTAPRKPKRFHRFAPSRRSAGI
jgi:hypothetical protein